jgi:DNA polymerase-3 subunit epsilon
MKLSEFILGRMPFCLLDIETSGFLTDTHEILEISAIQVGADFDIIGETSCLIRTANRVPSLIAETTGITDDMLRAHGLPLAEVLLHIHRFVGERPVYAHNAQFDRGFLNASAAREGLDIRFSLACSIPVFKRLLPGRESYGLQTLAKAFQLEDDGAHRALADCRMLLGCLKRAHRNIAV